MGGVEGGGAATCQRHYGIMNLLSLYSLLWGDVYVCVCVSVWCVCAVYLCEVNSILAIVVAASTICGRVQHTNMHTHTRTHRHSHAHRHTHTNTHQYVCPFQSSINVFCYDFHTSCSPPQKCSRTLCCCLCRCVCSSVCLSVCLSV